MIHPAFPLIRPSDRGLQYCADSYQQGLNKNNIPCNMTASANHTELRPL